MKLQLLHKRLIFVLRRSPMFDEIHPATAAGYFLAERSDRLQVIDCKVPVQLLRDRLYARCSGRVPKCRHVLY